MAAVLLFTLIPYLYSKTKNGGLTANSMIELKGGSDKPLLGILSLNTVALPVGEGGVGAQAIVVFWDTVRYLLFIGK